MRNEGGELYTWIIQSTLRNSVRVERNNVHARLKTWSKTPMCILQISDKNHSFNPINIEKWRRRVNTWIIQSTLRNSVRVERNNVYTRFFISEATNLRMDKIWEPCTNFNNTCLQTIPEANLDCICTRFVSNWPEQILKIHASK